MNARDYFGINHAWKQILVCGVLVVSLLCRPVLAENGVTKGEIIIGQTTALSGPLGELGQDLTLGAKIYFDLVNANGGISGRKIRLVTLDDGYNPQKAVENAKKLIEEEKVFLLFGVIGTPANIAMLPIIEKEGIPNFAPTTGATILRSPFNRLVFNVRASYSDEVEKIVEHCYFRGMRKFAVAYQNNAFGKDSLSHLETTLKQKNISVFKSAAIESDGSNVTQAVKELSAAAPDVLLLFTAGKSSVDFIKSFKKTLPYVQIVTLSTMGTQASINALGQDAANIIVAQVAPFPFSGTNSLVLEFQHAMQKAGVKNWSFTMIEGFLSAKVLVTALKRTGQNITRDSFIQAVETMGDENIGGYYVSYSRTDHHGSRFVDLTFITRQGKFIR